MRPFVYSCAWLVVLAFTSGCPTPPAVPDGGVSDGGVDDGGQPQVVTAVIDSVCPPSERLGLLKVGQEGSLSFSVELYDRPQPWMAQAADSSDACDLFVFAEGCACDVGETCDSDGNCIPAPVEHAVTVTASVGGDEEVFPPPANSVGGHWGTLTLPSDNLAFTLATDDLVIEVPAMSLPSSVPVQMTQTGTFESPIVDLSWSAPDDVGTHMATTIPINHHVGSPTHTRCVVDADAEALHVEGDLVDVLAVITGLEFQTMEHTRFASATLDEGCVDIRFLTYSYPQW